MSDIYSFKVQLPKGELDLAPYKTNGKDLLFVNVASKCGLTPQYKDLQALQDKDADKLQIIGFPCNQVGIESQLLMLTSSSRARSPELTTRSRASARSTTASPSPLPRR